MTRITDNLSSDYEMTIDPTNTSNLSQVSVLIQNLHGVKPSSEPYSTITSATRFSRDLHKSILITDPLPVRTIILTLS